jgi:hypothetical protein
MKPEDRKRVQDIGAALKRSKPKDLLALEHLAILWGVTKPRFVTVQRAMVGFPDPKPAPKEMGLPANSHVYAAIPALKAMLAYAGRHQVAARAKQALTDAILGVRRDSTEPEVHHTPNELAVLSRLRAETEERERQQGLYVPVAEIAAVAGDVFSEISDWIEKLPNAIDPHGELPPATRVAIRDRGREELLQLHKRMKHILTRDVAPSGDPKKARGPRLATRSRPGSITCSPNRRSAPISSRAPSARW